MDPYKMMAIGWFAAIIVLLIIEFCTQALVTIWFAIGSVLGLFGAAMGIDFLWQLILMLILSVIMLIFTKPILNEYVNKKLIKTNVDTLEGQIGVVKETINNLEAKGLVLLNGMDWTARSESGETIEPETRVIVKKVEGVKLIVAKVQ
ncbi:MAG: NfeD family protein [Lachnospiraceae bacterium]|nr:NfeD family protein [Lachnospiraceae bacterium]